MYQKIRTSLFYISIAVFFISVPLTLIFSFGYDVTWGKLKFSRAGLINISSKPEGAAVYLNGKYTGEVTPASLKELKPGIYDLRLQLEDYYPWENSVVVKDGMVSDSKEVTLFRRIPHMDKINIEEVADFVLDKTRDNIFFISKENNSLYKIDTKGRTSRTVYRLPFSVEKIKKWLISFDNKKIVYLVGNNIYVGFLIDSDSRVAIPKDFTIVVPEEIVDIFWYFDNEHIIVVETRDIKVFELFSQGKNNTVSLATLNYRRPKVFYDAENNILYFTDQQETSAGRYHNLYKIQLGRHQILPFMEEIEKK